MKIVATLDVKDEVELIEKNIGHLRAIGVDHIIACDFSSTDGSYELLQAHRSDEDFWVLRLDDQIADEFQTWARTLIALVKSAKADWAIFLDADEFWIPASGSLKDCAALPSADVVSLDRYNVPLSPDGPMMPDELRPPRYEDLLLITMPIEDYADGSGDLPWIWAKAEPKVMGRPARIRGLDHGCHDVFPLDATRLRRSTTDDLFIAHLPFTTRSRFHRKVENIRRTFSVHDDFFGESLAWHWRRWLTLADQGRLDEEFDRTVFDATTMTSLRGDGSIRSAAEIFRAPTP
jgi:glycosyltransferase involved in cell wall biosynthesis